MSTKKLQKNETLADLATRLMEATGSQSLSEVAKKLGVKPSTLWNWAHGRTEIPNTILDKIAKDYKISLNWLLSGEGSKNPYLFVPTENINPEIHQELVDFIRDEIRRQIESYRKQHFDPEEHIRAGRPPDEILRDWLKSEGIEVPGDFGIIFFGWDSMSDSDKVSGLESAKKILAKKLKEATDRDNEKNTA